MDFQELKTYQEPSIKVQKDIVQRPAIDTSSLSATIRGIFDRVAMTGDQAILELTEQFDKVKLETLSVSSEEINKGESLITTELKNAIDHAYNNIRTFHLTQQLESQKIETSPGVQCWRESRAIDKVGLYIPGGSAPLFSTVLMLGIPAQIAGCSEIVLCSPPNAEGDLHPAILYAAQLCGIDRIFKVGGAQAVAAMTLGTASIPGVYKIFGPGNQYVTAAKMKSQESGVAIDLPAGPSEVLVYADSSCRPNFVAADLLSQAEHGPDSQVVLVTDTRKTVEQVNQELRQQLELLPRKEIAYRALQHAYACIVKDIDNAFSFINRYAPEHLIISSDRAERYIDLVNNAGSVFLGHWTPESAGDYASGTNHTLPTSAYARAYSGVSLDSFTKQITFQRIDREGIQNLGPTIRVMAAEEQLHGHAQAVKLRMDAL